VEALFVSAGVAILAEFGDKSQLLAILLASRFRKSLPIILGIFIATVCNQMLAALAGKFAADWLGENLRWVLALSFLAMAVWMLIPENVQRPSTPAGNLGAFGATLISFFIVEIGDKTELATVALAARFHSIIAVAAGTTLGMMIVNVPAVYLANYLSAKVPVRALRYAAALIFFLLAFATALDFGRRLLFA
jgi:Ca2+/H+ antiporter, TMEM165/GDT1 family